MSNYHSPLPMPVKTLLISTLLMLLVASPLAVVAATNSANIQGNLDAAAPAELKGASTKTLPVYIGTVIKGLLQLLGAVFLLLTLYGGWLWMTAQGDTTQVSKAKNIILSAIIGLIIIAGSYALTNFIFTNVLPS